MSSGIETDYLMFRNTALYNTIFLMYNSINYIKKNYSGKNTNINLQKQIDTTGPLILVY